MLSAAVDRRGGYNISHTVLAIGDNGDTNVGWAICPALPNASSKDGQIAHPTLVAASVLPLSCEVYDDLDREADTALILIRCRAHAKFAPIQLGLTAHFRQIAF